jgi:hypothetical protein
MHAIKSTERHSDPMEHRWGQRVRLEVPVRLAVAGRAFGRGLLRNASISGALIESALELPIFSNLVVSIPSVGDLAASIVRCGPGMFAIEWRDMACPSIVALLERVTGLHATALLEDDVFVKGGKSC